MNKQKFETILDRLLKLSEQHNLNWKVTANSDKYLLTLNDSAIVMGSIYSGIGLIINFEFKNEKGETVELVSVNRKTEHPEYYDKCRKLYDLAQQQTSSPDDTIDRILEQLAPDSIAV